MKLDHSKGAPPLYHQLKEILIGKIKNGEYKAGEKIETEKELQDRYGLSRITVRQALNELVNEGYLHRQRGKGTVVLGKSLLEEHLVQVKSFTDEMKERGYEPGTLSQEVSVLQADEKLADKLKTAAGSRVYKVTRIRTANGIPVVFFETYLPASLPLDENALKNMDSLYMLFAERRILIHHVKECFEVAWADRKRAKGLDVAENFPLLLRTRESFDPNGEVIEYTRAHYHSKLYKFHLEMKGRQS
ncbi:GntR family transcriptional regulator [Melghirimyces profundicolus]|uniref:GntR family transcriptional regulator n=1 Tax=Melghirimyces profundicolus TaxID=1242148 RepID=A0A2T6C7X1_9BACL|nr:GntR family transcriptional regulator [Melghirimyces profundicolus]PTX64417.1 GntR family transcriptional regulator [Melghirimyces profundicolus]